MSKKHRTNVPDFSSHKPIAGQAAPPMKKVKAPTPTPRVKPPATSAKSGRRGG